jgi:hypothetical protein
MGRWWNLQQTAKRKRRENLMRAVAAAAAERQQGWWHWVVAIVPCLSCYHSLPLCALAVERACCTQQQTMMMTKMDSCNVGFMGGM